MTDSLAGLAADMAATGASGVPYALGTVVEAPDGRVLVAVDGSDEAVECRTTTMVHDGDRVRVSPVGGTLTITGNLTSPATDSGTFARTLADIPASMNCIKQTDRGLVVGSTDGGGNFVGSRTLLGDSLYFIGPNDEVIGVFSPGGISLGGCEMEVCEDGEFAGLNIYSSIGRILMTCSRIYDGSAGSSMHASPPMVRVGDSAVRMSAGCLVADSGGISGSSEHSVEVCGDGTYISGDVYIDGNVYINGKKY